MTVTDVAHNMIWRLSDKVLWAKTLTDCISLVISPASQQVKTLWLCLVHSIDRCIQVALLKIDCNLKYQTRTKSKHKTNWFCIYCSKWKYSIGRCLSNSSNANRSEDEKWSTQQPTHVHTHTYTKHFMVCLSRVHARLTLLLVITMTHTLRLRATDSITRTICCSYCSVGLNACWLFV